jgi:hypothetical protein
MADVRQIEASTRPATPDNGSGFLHNPMKRLATLALFSGVFLALAGSRAHASVSLLLEQPYGGLGVVNPTGHSALYLDHVCAATPTELRPCQPGELGVVISRYDGITNHDWVAVPLLPYLYAVESPADIPETMDRKREAELRDLYRRHALESVAPDLPDGGAPEGNWYELAGSALDRTIYGFSVATTPEQDADLIAMFNDRRNVQRYNGAFNNCADFARTTINSIYPHAIRRNFVADFGLTTPKSVARGLTHFASKHPDVAFRVFVVPQVPGSIPRSYGVQGVTESLIKRYGVPLVVLSPIATGIIFVAYMGHGRFDMPKHAPALDLRQTPVDVDEAMMIEPSSPPSLPLPTPSGVPVRTLLPAGIITHESPPPAIDPPPFDPAGRLPADLFAPSANE